MGEAPFKQPLLKRGDIVVYVYPNSPEWHGTLAIVDREEAQEYGVWIRQYLLAPIDFPYNKAWKFSNGSPWLRRAWEKIGEVPDADI